MYEDPLGITKHINELRELVAEKLLDDPLPMGHEAELKLQADLREHGLEANIADLETQGYTILPPGKAAPIEFVERLRDTVLQIADRSDPGFGEGRGLGTTLFHLLPQDRIFEEALMAPAPQALMTYLLGYRAKLSQSTGLIKDSGAPALGIHADHSSKLPAPWGHVSNYCVVTWVLTEYTRENGAVCVWPGSHRWGRPIPEDLRMSHDHPEMRVLEVPAGSVIVWHGSLWHGAVPRSAEGRRATLVFPHVREGIQPQELYWATTTPEMIERNPARFGTLMGLSSAMPWVYDGPDPTRLMQGPATGNQFE